MPSIGEKTRQPENVQRNDSEEIDPFWVSHDGEVTLYQGHVIDVLKKLPAKSVHMCVTSPPYWGLRDYGTDKSLEIGAEKTPEEFVQTMVAVFREVHRVLRDDGTLWLNLGDSYSAGGWECKRRNLVGEGSMSPEDRKSGKEPGVGVGNLVGAPWRVALALQADGRILRQDIIWSKPSPMPESVKNRCTKAHEYLFLFAKKMGYFYDKEAIREKGLCEEVSEEEYKNMKDKAASKRWYQGSDAFDFGEDKKQDNPHPSFTPPGGETNDRYGRWPHRGIRGHTLRRIRRS